MATKDYTHSAWYRGLEVLRIIAYIIGCGISLLIALPQPTINTYLSTGYPITIPGKPFDFSVLAMGIVITWLIIELIRGTILYIAVGKFEPFKDF